MFPIFSLSPAQLNQLNVPSSFVPASSASSNVSSASDSSAPDTSILDNSPRVAEWLLKQQDRAFQMQSETNQASAQKAMDFSERMYRESRDYEASRQDSYYQRAVKDLQRAGLNPLLAIQSGFNSPYSSVSAPSGVSASAALPNYSNYNYATDEYRAIMSLINSLSTSALKGIFDVATTFMNNLTSTRNSALKATGELL